MSSMAPLVTTTASATADRMSTHTSFLEEVAPAAERLGAKRSTYLGRGQFREPDAVVAPGRRRHTREELEGGVV